MRHRHYDRRWKRGPSPAVQQVSARRKALVLSPLLSNIYLHYGFYLHCGFKALETAQEPERRNQNVDDRDEPRRRLSHSRRN
jgi:hypothetical protein